MAADWSKVKHFEREEFVKNPDRVDEELVLLLDEMREFAGKPFKVHVAWDDSGHVNDSAHYSGHAVDGHFEGLALLDQWLLAERFPWTGIGIYPFWSNPGLHLELIAGRHAGTRWWRDSEGDYRSLDRRLLSILLTLPPARTV